jgi:hypothetical protein
MASELGIVTATTNREKAEPCLASWQQQASEPLALVVTVNGLPPRGQGSGRPKLSYLGTVRAFREGVEEMFKTRPEVEIIACLHDDLVILEKDWDQAVLTAFRRHPEVGLAGFGGAIGLGADDLYQAPYDPIQLARIGYRSNTVDAETHGARSLLPEPVVCLDGFSQIGRRAFWQGFSEAEWRTHETRRREFVRAWRYLEDQGFVHHFYDGALGCLARRLGWQVYYLPVRCRHLGGQTAVGDPGYQEWAEQQIKGGDRGFWEQAHRTGYDLFKDVLPLRVQSAGG